MHSVIAITCNRNVAFNPQRANLMWRPTEEHNLSMADSGNGPGSLEKALEEKVFEERLKLAASLVVAEYNALRGEVQQAMDSAQGAVRWSTATFGVLIVAGLVATNNAQTTANYWAGAMALVIFGLVLPGLICSGAWTWLGELHRMERAGAHLRGIETRIGAVPGLQELLGGQPIWQERFIIGARRRKSALGKQSLAYAGTAVLFGGAAGTSLAIFLGWHREMFHWSAGSPWGL